MHNDEAIQTVVRHLLDVQLIRMCSSMLLQFLPVSGQDVELGNDIKEAASAALGSSYVGV